jgi:hypothetical protein
MCSGVKYGWVSGVKKWEILVQRFGYSDGLIVVPLQNLLNELYRGTLT